MASGASPFQDRPEPTERTLGDLLALVWRQRMIMLAVFAGVTALGLVAAVGMKTSYTAYSNLIVRLGQEYVYNPQVGDAARGTAPESDQVVQSEVEILSSTALKQRVIRRIGLDKLYPALGRAYAKASSEAKRTEIEGAAVKAMDSALKIGTAPGTAVVRLSFDHAEPQMAAQALNVMIEEYLAYRSSVLAERDSGALAGQRLAFQNRLGVIDSTFQKFLADNGIGDFDTEKSSMGQLYTALITESYSLQAQLSEAQGRLTATNRSASTAPPEIGLYQDVDGSAATKLMQLKIDRQDLLSRYRPDAQPVRDLDQKIAALQALTSSPQGTAAGAKRVGVNPVYQSLQTEKNTLEAQTASIQARQAVVARELEQVTRRRQILAQLEPQYQALAREREVLSTNVRNFIVREQESEAAQALAAKSNDNIRVVERAQVPLKGKSLKKAVLALGILFGGFSALCVGLFLALLSRGYAGVAAVERSLDLPVLAAMPLKRGAGG